MHIKMNNDLPENLISIAKKKSKTSVAIVCAHEFSALQSAKEAYELDLINPIFIGNKNEIQKEAEKLNWNINNFDIIKEENEYESAIKAAKLAKDDFYRADSLKDRGVISIKKWRFLKTRVEMKNQEARKAAAKVKVAEAALRSAKITRDEIDVLQHELSRHMAQKAHLVAKIDGKKIQIDKTNIFSPIDGVIDKSFISSGEMAQSGQRLFLMHDPSYVWIEANIKETRLRNLKIGQLVSVQVDAYPNQIYSGKLVRIGDATTSQFALLPAPNPSGNFTKVTQRIPVRIEIKQRSNHLRPGMMVELNIEIDADDG